MPDAHSNGILKRKMLYPAYIHQGRDGSLGITLPDFPGCFSSVDALSGVHQAVQEAVEVHFEGESFQVPEPSTPKQWRDDERYQGGYWMLVEIDLRLLATQTIN